MSEEDEINVPLTLSVFRDKGNGILSSRVYKPEHLKLFKWLMWNRQHVCRIVFVKETRGKYTHTQISPRY